MEIKFLLLFFCGFGLSAVYARPIECPDASGLLKRSSIECDGGGGDGMPSGGGGSGGGLPAEGSGDAPAEGGAMPAEGNDETPAEGSPSGASEDTSETPIEVPAALQIEESLLPSEEAWVDSQVKEQLRLRQQFQHRLPRTSADVVYMDKLETYN